MTGDNNFVQELMRRRVVRVAATYGLIAWIVVQITEVVAEPLGAPDWFLRSVIIVVLIGFPVAVLVSWVYDLTPQGLVKTADADAQGITRKAPSRAIDFAVIGLLLVVILFQWLSSNKQDADFRLDKSIAVLPFADLSASGDAEYFGDGIAEELLNVLGKISDLRVAARTSSFAYKGKNQDVRSIGEKLNVNTVLEGSVRKSGNRVRITAQLISVEDGFHLWSETYDRELTDIFEIQDSIAKEIVDELKLRLSGSQVVAEAKKDRTDSIDAYEAYQLGLFGLRQRTEDGLSSAITYFTQALDADPEYKKAYTGLAQANLLLVSYGNFLAAQAVPAAQEAIDEALALDPELADAYAAQGLLYGVVQDSPKAEKALLRAIELDPKHAMAHMWYASNLNDQRKFDHAMRAYERAYQLEPDSIPLNINMAGAYFKRGNYDRAIEHYERLLNNDSRKYRGSYRQSLANAYRLQGKFAQAIQTWREQLIVDPYDTVSMKNLARAYTDLEDFETAKFWADTTIELDPEQILNINLQAELMLAQKRNQESLVFVNQAIQKQLDQFQEMGMSPPPFFLAARARAEALAGNYRAAHELLVAALETFKNADDDGYTITNQVLEWAPYAAMSFREAGDLETSQSLINQTQARLQTLQSQGFDSANDYSNRALIKAVAGNVDGALADMRQADTLGWRRYWWWDVDPAFESVRQDSRYNALIAQGRAKLTQARTEIAALNLTPFSPPVRPQPVPVNANLFADYVGRYQGAGFVLDITQQQGNLYAQRVGQKKFHLLATSTSEFYFDGVAADLTFVKNDDEQVTHIDLHQSGMQYRVKRFDDVPERVIAAVDPVIYGAYVGRYQAHGDNELFIDIFVEDNRLFGRITGQGSLELLPLSATRFFSNAFEGVIDFVMDEEEKVNRIDVAVNEVVIRAVRVQ